jgi:hypothetical protein
MTLHISWTVLAFWFWGILMLNLLIGRRSTQPIAMRVTYMFSATLLGLFWSWIIS